MNYKPISHKQYLIFLAVIFFLYWSFLAIEPFSLGALAAMIVTAIINIHVQKDFAQQWIKSLRVKHARPLGEDEIVRLWKRKKTK